MPTYVYECKTCQKTSEVEQRITEDAFKELLCECTPDQPQPVRRLIQPVGIAFKGSGFHINDYAATSSSPAATPTAKSEAAPKTETAPSASTAAPTTTESAAAGTAASTATTP